MAIGTSLGAYFEDEFHHQAGMDTPPEVVKPADTGDDNVVPPDDSQPQNNGNTPIPVMNLTNTPGEIMEGLEGTRSYPSGFNQPEKVKSAALKLHGELYEAENHGMALNNFHSKYPGKEFDRNWEEGFTTTHGRFISRNEAMDMARKMDQINHPDIANDPSNTWLLSEDLK